MQDDHHSRMTGADDFDTLSGNVGHPSQDVLGTHDRAFELGHDLNRCIVFGLGLSQLQFG